MKLNKKELQKLKQKRDLCSKVILSQFPSTPQGRLMHAIVDQAIKDATKTNIENFVDDREKVKARKFLNGHIWSAEICGVNSEWVRRVINKYDLGWAPRGG